MDKRTHRAYFDHLHQGCKRVDTLPSPIATTARNLRLQVIKHTQHLGSMFQYGGNMNEWSSHLVHLVRFARGSVPLLDEFDTPKTGANETPIAPIGKMSPAFMAAIEDSDLSPDDAEFGLSPLTHLLTEYSVRGYLSGKPGATPDDLRDGKAPLVAGDYLLEAITKGNAVVTAAFIGAGARLQDAERAANARMKRVPAMDGVEPHLIEIDDLLRNHVGPDGGIEIVLQADRRQRSLLMSMEIAAAAAPRADSSSSAHSAVSRRRASL